MESNFSLNIFVLVVTGLFFLLFNAFIFLSWFSLFKLRLGKASSESIVFSLISYFTQLIIVALIIGYAGILYRSIYIVFNLMISIYIFSLNKSNKSLLSYFKESFASVFGRRSFCYLIPTLLILVYLVIRNAKISLLNIPSLGDDLLYHIPALFQWVTDHKISSFPSAIIYQITYPYNTELILLNPIIFFKLDNFILFYHFIICLVGYIAVGYSILRMFGLGKHLSLGGGILLFMTPAIANGVFTGYIDTIINLLILSLFYFFIKLIKNFSEKSYHYYYLLLLIVLLGSKYSGAYIFGFWIFAYFILWLINGPRNIFKIFNYKVSIFLFSLFLLLGMSWYIRNYINYGNPLVPQKISILGNELFSSKYREASYIKLNMDFFAPNLSEKNNVDFFKYMEHSDGLFDKLKLVIKNYYNFPKVFYPDAVNQLGYIWAYALIFFIPIFIIYCLLRKKIQELIIITVLILFYLFHPYHTIYMTRYTSFVVIIGIISMFVIMGMFKNKIFNTFLLAIILVLGLFQIRNLGPMGNKEFVAKASENYYSGEYFGLSDASENYLKCYDFVRLKIRNKRVNYIGSRPYPYTYHLYGKNLNNKVYYFYTLDPMEWEREIDRNNIELVVNISIGEDKNFENIVKHIKNSPKFSPLIRDGEVKEDKYNVCREYFVYKVNK